MTHSEPGRAPLSWAHVATSFGTLVLGATGAGLAFVGLPKAPDPNLSPKTAPQWDGRQGAILEEAVRQLQEYDQRARREFTVPLDLDGTPFQRDVWRALLDIPLGQTVTYGEVALRVGRPGAARAVGMAVGQNPVPIIVPCHRVVGQNGRLTGYGGGLPLKQALLVHEGALLV